MEGDAEGDIGDAAEEDELAEDLAEDQERLEGVEDEDEEEEEEEEQPLSGQGRYPSRFRNRVNHYNPSVVEHKPRTRRRQSSVSPRRSPSTLEKVASHTVL